MIAPFERAAIRVLRIFSAMPQKRVCAGPPWKRKRPCRMRFGRVSRAGRRGRKAGAFAMNSIVACAFIQKDCGRSGAESGAGQGVGGRPVHARFGKSARLGRRTFCAPECRGECGACPEWPPNKQKRQIMKEIRMRAPFSVFNRQDAPSAGRRAAIFRAN